MIGSTFDLVRAGRDQGLCVRGRARSAARRRWLVTFCAIIAALIVPATANASLYLSRKQAAAITERVVRRSTGGQINSIGATCYPAQRARTRKNLHTRWRLWDCAWLITVTRRNGSRGFCSGKLRVWRVPRGTRYTVLVHPGCKFISAPAPSPGSPQPPQPQPQPLLKYWNDATLDCYPTDGGLLGGGTGNTSVRLSILWKWPTNTTVWLGWRVLYEVYLDGAGPYWQLADGTWGTSSPFYGPYRVNQYGIVELSQQLYNYDGSYSTVYSPWTDEQTYSKSVRTYVRAWVGLQTYNSSTGWSSITWNLATPLHQPVGSGAGFCSL